MLNRHKLIRNFPNPFVNDFSFGLLIILSDKGYILYLFVWKCFFLLFIEQVRVLISHLWALETPVDSCLKLYKPCYLPFNKRPVCSSQKHFPWLGMFRNEACPRLHILQHKVLSAQAKMLWKLLKQSTSPWSNIWQPRPALQLALISFTKETRIS